MTAKSKMKPVDWPTPLSTNQAVAVSALMAGHTAPELMAENDRLIKRLKATHKERTFIGEIDGVQVEVRPFLSQRGHERAMVGLGPEKLYFAQEWISIPWSFLKPITVSYWVWLDRDSVQGVEDILKKSGVGKWDTEEDPYADPARYQVWVDTLEDVVRIWKVTPKVAVEYTSIDQTD